MKKICLFLFAAVLALSCVHAGITVTNYTVLPSTVRPGIAGAVVLTISNLDEKDISDLAVLVESSDLLGSGGQFSYGEFKTGVSTVATVPFRVSSGTNAGIYTMRMKFSWFTEDGAGNKFVNIPIVVQNPASFQIEGKEHTIYAQDGFVLEGKIKNSGGKALDARLSIDSGAFLPEGASVVLLGDLQGERDFRFPISFGSDVTSGEYSIPLTIDYIDELGGAQSANVPVTVNLIKLGPDFLASVSGGNTLTQGDKASIGIALQNIGNEDAYNAYLSVVNSSALTPIGKAEVGAGTIRKGESKTVQFDAGVNDVAPGFYPLQFKLRYENSKGEAQPPKYISTGFNIAGKNEVSFFISAKPSPVAPGSPYTLQVLVSNVGSTPLKALVVSVNSSAIVLLDAQPSQFIGGLSQDDFSTVQYKIYIPDEAKPGKYPISVKASFKDAYNKDHVVGQDIPLEIVSKEVAMRSSEAKGNGGPSPVAIVLALLVIAALAYFGYKRFFAKKKEKGQASL